VIFSSSFTPFVPLLSVCISSGSETLNFCSFCVELQGLAAKKESGKEIRDTNRSFLSIELEVDPEQLGNNSFSDSEANVYQLALACQKVFSTVRGSMKEMPVEFLTVRS